MAMEATTSASAAATAAGAKIDTGRTRLASSYETFLALLTTQLKNQDPTAPLDTNTFTQQLVQMSGVEQQLLTNDLLKGLTEKADSGLSGAVGYIGKTVTARTNGAALEAGRADWSYTLDRNAKAVVVEVLDAAGRVVRREAGETGAGAHAFAWDGRDQAGGRLADGGLYTLRVEAADAAGAKLTPAITTQGIVRAVEQADGETRLILNGAAVPLSAVTAVRQSA